MEIYVIQSGDSIVSIANKYGISVERLISDNGLVNPYTLVVGQTLVILYPKNTYTVKSGDTLESIAESNGISLMQLMRNNPFLHDREYIYQGETLVINYNTIRDIQTNAYSTAYISPDTLSRVLPYLTFISIYNYHLADDSSITSYGDDTTTIKIAKQYNVIPLMMISAISPTGEINVAFVYRFLLDIELQDKFINEMFQILKAKELFGINLLISYISEYNQSLYITFFEKISELLRIDGYIFMITISPDFSLDENLDYLSISQYVDRIIFIQNIWEMRKQPPAPISDISSIRPFIKHVISKVSPNYISIAKPIFGLDWIIPFHPSSTASLMSLNSTIVLAYDQRAVIQFDEVSQTPNFNYNRSTVALPENHIVWFIDARSIKALDDVIIENGLVGSGIWNLNCYNQQLFSMLNAVYNIVKLPIQ